MHTLNPNHTTHNTYPQTTTLNKPLLPTPTHTNKTLLPTPHITSKHKTPLIAHPPYTITLLPTPLLFTHITHTERKKLLPTQCTSIYSTTQHHNAHPTNPNITYHQSNTTNPNPNTRLYTSPNPDFAQAVKATFKFVQLHHHYKNWKHKTPNKIEQNIQHLFTNITPPNPNNEFNITMKAMQEFVSCDIRQLVREHIEDEIKQTITDLEHLNPHDKSLIIHTASRQLHNTLKNKIQPQEIRQLLAEAFYMLGLRYNSKRIHITSTDLTHNTPQTHTTTTHTDMEIENNSPTQQTPTNNHQSDTSATSTHTEKSNNTHTTNTDTTYTHIENENTTPAQHSLTDTHRTDITATTTYTKESNNTDITNTDTTDTHIDVENTSSAQHPLTDTHRTDITATTTYTKESNNTDITNTDTTYTHIENENTTPSQHSLTDTHRTDITATTTYTEESNNTDITNTDTTDTHIDVENTSSAQHPLTDTHRTDITATTTYTEESNNTDITNTDTTDTHIDVENTSSAQHPLTDTHRTDITATTTYTKESNNTDVTNTDTTYTHIESENTTPAQHSLTDTHRTDITATTTYTEESDNTDITNTDTTDTHIDVENTSSAQHPLTDTNRTDITATTTYTKESNNTDITNTDTTYTHIENENTTPAQHSLTDTHRTDITATTTYTKESNNTDITNTDTTDTHVEVDNTSTASQTSTDIHRRDITASTTLTEQSNNTHTTNTDTTDAVNTARKRKLTDRSPPTPLHNDSPLTPQNNSPITINSTPDTSDTDTQTSPIQHINFSDTSAELNLTSSTDSYTDQAGILHKQITTNKENWKIHDTPPHITTLIIGDSNLRQWTDIPYNWMVECLPGAKIVHIHNILQKHTLSTSLTRLVISIGINNRTETTLNNDKYLRQLHNLTKTLSIDTHFLAPSFTHALPADQQVNLRKLNDTASKLFKNNYVAPLCHQQTTILKSDKHKIHHTKDTSDLLIRMVQDHLNYLDHIKRRKT